MVVMALFNQGTIFVSINMKKNIFMLFTAAALCSGCHQKTAYPVIELKDNPVPVFLESEVVEVPDLCSPSRVYYNDSALFFKDNKSKEAQVYVHNLKNKKTGKFIKMGRGPGEMLGVFYLAFINDFKTTLIFDISLGDIIEAKTDSLLQDGYFPQKKYVKKPLGQKVLCVTGCGDRLLAMGNYDDARVVEIQRDDTLKLISGYYPDIHMKKDYDFAMRSYDGVIKANEDRNACVVACRYADQIEIIDLKAGTPVFIKGPELFEPVSKLIDTGKGKALAHGPEERKGYVDICCNSKYIYALYSGRSMEDKNSSYGKNLRVFKWDGDYVAEYILDHDVIAIDIDSETNTIFAISSFDQILEYHLN